MKIDNLENIYSNQKKQSNPQEGLIELLDLLEETAAMMVYAIRGYRDHNNIPSKKRKR